MHGAEWAFEILTTFRLYEQLLIFHNSRRQSCNHDVTVGANLNLYQLWIYKTSKKNMMISPPKHVRDHLPHPRVASAELLWLETADFQQNRIT